MQTKIIESGKSSNKGMIRTTNEDSMLTLELSLKTNTECILANLYAVADGLGGLEDGEIASKIAIRSLSETVLSSILPALRTELCLPSQELIQKLLSDAVQLTNQMVFNWSQKENKRLGTTLTTLFIVGSNVVIANIGDSRIYLLRDGVLRKLTIDHSFVAGLVEKGEIKPEEVYTYPYRNIITRCLGMESNIEIDLYNEEIKSGDTYLLCSDGLWEMVLDDEIHRLIEQNEDPQVACEKLIQTANQNGGTDNISVILFKVLDPIFTG